MLFIFERKIIQFPQKEWKVVLLVIIRYCEARLEHKLNNGRIFFNAKDKQKNLYPLCSNIMTTTLVAGSHAVTGSYIEAIGVSHALAASFLQQLQSNKNIENLWARQLHFEPQVVKKSSPHFLPSHIPWQGGQCSFSAPGS